MTRPPLSKRSARAGRARLEKKRLLPIPRAVAAELALHAHLSLEAIGADVDEIPPAQAVSEVVLLARYLSDARRGVLPDETCSPQTARWRGCDCGRDTGRWDVSSQAIFALLAAIVWLYDRQLQTAPLAALTTTSDRLDRYKAGEAYQPLQKRRA